MIVSEESNNIAEDSDKLHSRFKKRRLIVGTFIVFLLLIAYVWFVYVSSAFQKQRELVGQYERAAQAMKDFEEAMRNDTYGGKTPQETLNLFIEALKKDDIELASRYFILELDERDPAYLTQEKPLLALREFRIENKLENLVNLLNTVRPDNTNRIHEGDYGFAIYENDRLISEINMEFNKYSGVWKLESL
ncbi:hypothetical protein HY967_00940 [Candidatus Jorgensenbacteria bacterium]|nr:hypothetical protein [Candidatus Jorgensenbacteria bacterium]